MAYFTINNTADSGLFVTESIRKYKDTVHENIVGLWREKRPSEEPPQIDKLLEFMADDLDDSRVGLVDSLGHYLNETSGGEISTLEQLRVPRTWIFPAWHCTSSKVPARVNGRSGSVAIGG